MLQSFCESDDQLMLVLGVLLDTELQDGAGQGEEQEGPRVVSFLEILQARENFRRKTRIVGTQYTGLGWWHKYLIQIYEKQTILS